MQQSEQPAARDDAASILRELLDCTELNLDDLEEHTRAVIDKARALLGQKSADE